MDTKKRIRLLALDVDGTLFTNKGIITQKTIEAIKAAQKAGVTVIIASGREFDGAPLEQLEAAGIDVPYVITANGAAVYKVSGRECLSQQCMPIEKIESELEMLMNSEVHVTAFIDGHKFVPAHVVDYVDNMGLPAHIAERLKKISPVMDDFMGYIKSDDAKVQKFTLNFQRLPDGTCLNRDKVAKVLYACPHISVVNGGFSNLEMTAKGVNKGQGLRALADKLGIDMEETMAIGDSENDLDMIIAAGVGVAMENADAEIKEASDFVTLSNENDGVAYAIEKYILS